jgi:hypothetical protein
MDDLRFDTFVKRLGTGNRRGFLRYLLGIGVSAAVASWQLSARSLALAGLRVAAPRGAARRNFCGAAAYLSRISHRVAENTRPNSHRPG